MRCHLFWLICFFGFLSGIGYGQKGEFYLSHFSPEDEHIENENFAIVQDDKGLMYFANSNGLLKYDGKYWELIKTPSTVLSLAKEPGTGTIYISCLDNIGYLSTDDLGKDQYVSLYESVNGLFNVNKIFFNKGFIYFRGEGQLFECDGKTKKIASKWVGLPGLGVGTAFTHQELIYLTDKENGFFSLRSGKIKPEQVLLPEGEGVVFATEVDKFTTLIGTDANKLYTFNGDRFTYLKTEDENYLKNAVVNNGIVVDNNLAVIATNKGGCVIINIKNGKTIAIVNYYSGLPDDEVFAIAKDRLSGVWIAHEYGFTRLDYNLPFRCFSTYPGLEGHVESAITFNNKLYTATSEGLFYLAEIKDYVDFTKYKKKQKSEQKEEAREGKMNSFIRKQKEKFERIKEFFGIRKSAEHNSQDKKKKILGIFPKKDKPAIIKTKIDNITRPAHRSNTQSITNTGVIPVKFAFRKVEGMMAKCRQLITSGNRLFVASNGGIFEITDTKALNITEAPISYLHASPSGKLYAGNEYRQLCEYTWMGKAWKLTQQFDLPEEATNITEDNQHHLWVSCYSTVFRISTSGTQNHIDTIPVSNPFSDDILLINTDKKMKIIIGHDVYKYDDTRHQLIRSKDTIFKNPSTRLIQSQQGIVWYRDVNDWNYMSSIVAPNKNYSYLKLFKDIQDIIIDQDLSHCWIVTKSDGLYLFDISNPAPDKEESPILIRSVNDNSGNQMNIRDFRVEQNNSFITVTFVNPDYLDNAGIQYQYMLKGLNEEWSPWSSKNEISFPSLATGSYELLVRSRNAINKITEKKVMVFDVYPPYWQQWWFYLLEVAFFGFLLIISIRLNRSNDINPWVSRILTFVTIVMVIEFIDTILVSFMKFDDSPVLAFLIQVGIALLILPFERVLSGILIREELNEEQGPN